MIAGILFVIVLVALCWLSADQLVLHRAGKLLLLASIVVIPLSVSVGGLLFNTVKRSSQTTFCMSCHEMTDYGRSLFVENRQSLPALHYQNRFISRETACYSCHTDYALFGDVKAKLNGLMHVWVHYVGKTPEKIALYRSYANRNCLQCHDDARGYQEQPIHQKHAKAIYAEQKSCLSCHRMSHDMKAVHQGDFWQAAGPETTAAIRQAP